MIDLKALQGALKCPGREIYHSPTQMPSAALKTANSDISRVGLGLNYSVQPKPKPKKRLSDLPEEWITAMMTRVCALGSLLWDYTDSILDMTAQMRLTATKPLGRKVREIRLEYDRMRQYTHATTALRKQEEEWGLDFEDLVQPHIKRFFRELQKELADRFGELEAQTRYLILGVNEAVMVSDALTHYTRGCDKALAQMEVDMAGKTVRPAQFQQLARLLPEFAGDLWHKDSPARAKAAEALAKSLLSIKVTCKEGDLDDIPQAPPKPSSQSTQTQTTNPKTKDTMTTNQDKMDAIAKTLYEMNDTMVRMRSNFNAAEKGNKAAAARVRKLSLELEPLLKRFRKESVEAAKANTIKRNN